MVIRCERCSTVYELDEALLSPTGSQVECARCQHVFTAFPPKAPGGVTAGAPAQAAPQAELARSSEPEPSPRQAEKVGAPASASPPAPSAVAAGAGPAAIPSRHQTPRVARSGPAPVYHPPASAAMPTTGRSPLLKRDTVGTFENRLRWSARWRWLAPLLIVLVVGSAAAAWFFLRWRSEHDDARARAEAVSLVALDDAASVEQAITRLDAVLRRAPDHRGAAADRALAYAVRAAAIVEEGESLAARLAARNAERERLRREQPPGWEEAERAAAADVQKLEPEVRLREERARSLGGAALQSLRRLQSEEGDTPQVARGLAAYEALSGDRELARKTIRAARANAPSDPWLDLVEGWVDGRDPDRSASERALVHLSALASAHPETLRARYLLARCQATLGHREEAIATLDGLLAANPRHEDAKRLREELAAPPSPLPPTPPPAAKLAPRPRRLSSRSDSPLPHVPADGSSETVASDPGAVPAVPPATLSPPPGAVAPPPGAGAGDPPPQRPWQRRDRNWPANPDGG